MGCDIHLFVEKKINGQWTSADIWTPEEITGHNYDRVSCNNSYYSGRNYMLFGLLAGVRDVHVPCIYNPRGIPQNLSPRIAAYFEEWDPDLHTHSYMTLEEIEKLPFNRPVNNDTFILTEVEYKKYQQFKTLPEHPDFARTLVTIRNGIVTTDDNYRQGSYPHDSEVYVVINHEFLIKDYCKHFYEHTIKRLKTLAKNHKLCYTDVRIIFAFDS